MILARASLLALMSALALGSVAARADVMEIDADGARWIAGGDASALSVLSDRSGDVSPTIPNELVADTTLNARGVPPRYAAKIAELSHRFDLSPSLLEAVVWQESRWREDAVSPAGARGLAQLMPGTARYLGVDPDDPASNLEGGARYLREQLDRFDGDLEKALAAYNAGPGRVIRAGGIPNIRETKHYVAGIMNRLASHARVDGR